MTNQDPSDGADTVLWNAFARSVRANAVRELIDLSLSHLVKATGPGFGTAIVCAMVTELAKYLAASVGIGGALALHLIAIPTAAAFLWWESATIRNLTHFGIAPFAIAPATSK